MCKKLEKLREVNALVAERCTKLETKIFLESSNGVATPKISTKESNNKTVVETKQ